MKMKLLVGAMALALIGCSEQRADETASTDNPPRPRNLRSPRRRRRHRRRGHFRHRPERNPGVAFDYAYAFRLDNNRIAKVQSEHAAACIARKFCADAIASVEKAEGVLADATIAGEDVGNRIDLSQQRSAGLTAEIERLEGRLKQGGLDRTERAELLRQIGEMRGQLGGERDSRRAGEARIAMTSVVFNYSGNGGLPGIGHQNPFGNAWTTLLASGGALLSIVLVAGAAILPWALLIVLIAFLWRRFRGGRPTEPPAPVA